MVDPLTLMSRSNFADEKVREILESAPDAVLMVGRGNRIVYANGPTEEMFGYPRAELLGQVVELLVPEPGRQEHARLSAAYWKEPRRRPMASGLNLVGRRKDGGQLPLEISLSPVRLGAETFVMAVIRDISERRRTEQELRASQERFAGILAIAEDAIISVDGDQRIILFNQGAERIFGYSASEVLGRPLDLLLPARFADAHRGYMAEFASSGQVARKMGERREVFGRHKDGTEFPAEASISRLELKGATVFTAMLRDITERKRTETAIRQLNEELEQRVIDRTAELAESNRQLARKNQENETFVYSVSHDLRSPLVNLEGFSRELEHSCGDLRKLLEEENLPEGVRRRGRALLDGDVAESIRFIRTAVGRLSGIIDALLRLSRAGRVVYQPRAVEMTSLVQATVEALSATVAERGAAVSVEPLPPAWGDPTALGQVFANLVANALNYCDPARPGRIEIGCTETARDGQTPSGIHHTYYVRDNGLGIPEAYRAKLFQAFQRLHPNAAPGEGMGLAIVHRIVERHGGKVCVEPAEGGGSVFLVTLPAPPPEEGGSRPEEPASVDNSKGRP